MKTKRIILKSLFVIATVSLVMTGCKKDKESDEDNDTSSSNENAIAEASYNDVDNICDEAGRNGSVSNYKMESTDGLLSSACATVTIDTVSNPHIMTINFGSTNCLCLDGRYRRGSIRVSYTGRYRDSASSHTITFNNYYVNENQIKGTKTVVNQGHITNGDLTYHVTVNGEILLANGGGTVTHVSDRTRVWLEGEGTSIWSDDKYSISGTANGKNSNGKSYTMTITSPLIRNMALGCRKHFVQGTFELTPDGKATRTIDYGSGACDNQATVTIKEKSYTITLK